jgi:hypothetical protein
LERRGLSERIQFRKPPRRGLSEQQTKANASRARIRSGIKHVFAVQKHRMALFVRTIGLARAQVKISMANLAYNFTRLAWLSTRTAPAWPRNSMKSGAGAKPIIQPHQQGRVTTRGGHPAPKGRAAAGTSRCPTG